MTSTLRRIVTDVATSLVMTLLPVMLIVAVLLVAASFRYGTVGNAIAALRGETFVIRPASQSFGVAHPGQEISLEYSLTNLTSQPTRLVGSRSSCACTVPERLPRTLNPRETHVFRVIFHVPDQPPTTPERSRYQEEVIVYTNDPSHPEVTLTFLGEVR